MTYKYKLSIVLIVIVGLCFSTTSKAQKLVTDSVAQKQIVNIAYGVQPLWMVSGAVSTVNGTNLQQQIYAQFRNSLTGENTWINGCYWKY